MENKLTELTPEDRSTLIELSYELSVANFNTPRTTYSTLEVIERKLPSKPHSGYMYPDIGNYIMSAIDFLYGSGDNGTGYSWLNLFWERYGEQSVEHLTPIGKPVAVTGYRNELKYTNFGNYSCLDRQNGAFRYTETIEAINLRIDAVEKILSKYSPEIVEYQRFRFGSTLKRIE